MCSPILQQFTIYSYNLKSTSCCSNKAYTHTLVASLQIGFIVALSAELLTERSIFKTVDYGEIALYGGAVLTVCLLAAAAAAVSNKRRLGLDVKEAVITSMTAVQRSAASVTGKQVDWAVDNIVNKVFSMGVIYSLLADDDLI